MSLGNLSHSAITLYKGLFWTRVIEVNSEINFTFSELGVTFVLSVITNSLVASLAILYIRLSNNQLCYL